MANREQLVTAETTPQTNRKQVVTAESSELAPFIQVVTVETTQILEGIQIAEAVESVIDFALGGQVRIAEKMESIIVFPQVFVVTGDVRIGEIALSITSEPKLAIVSGDIEIVETTDHVLKTEVTFIPNVKEAIIPNALNEITTDNFFQTCYRVTINDVDYSEVVIDVLNINKSDNSIVSFDINIMSQRELIDFIFQNIEVHIVATDENGRLEIVDPIVIGKIIGASKDVKTGVYNLGCLDYGGFHNTLGEYISKEITPMIEAEILINSEGTIDTGHKPILSVRVRVDDPDDPIRDGTDYFVNPLAGTITIPETSRLVGNSTMFDYEYPDNFDTLEDLMDNIAAEKGWTLDKNEVTIEEYTEPAKHPIITLSDESIIDMMRKFSELSAAKIDTSLFPTMRMYSELRNFFKAPVKQYTYERDMVDGSLEIGVEVEGFINKQIVTSANKVFPNAELGEEEVLLIESGIVPFEIVDTINYGGTGRPSWTDANQEATDLFVTLSPKVIATVTINDPSVTNSSITPSGTWFQIEPTIFAGFPAFDPSTPPDEASLIGIPGLTAFRDIVDGDWSKQINQGEVVFSLTSQPVMIDTGGWFTIGYEGAAWTATIKGQPVSYNEGTLDTNVEVTACRPANGTNDIYGDTYENAYIETATQAGNIANSILLTKGNVYSSIFTVPLHKASSLRLGDRITIYFNNNREHTGLIKELDYSVDFDTASALVTIRTEGVK